MTNPRPTLRLDKWLWHARFFKTRSLAAKTVSSGHVRVNGVHAAKPAHMVGPEDTLTFPQAKQVRVVTILDIGTRRGPAPEAQALYDDLTPPPPPKTIVPPMPRYEGKGRPTKKDRRNLIPKGGDMLE